MTITTDFEQLNQEKTVAELAIKIRADMEYTLRGLEEQITSIDGSIADVNFSSIPVSIRVEGANILDDFKTLRDHLNAEHSEFLAIHTDIGRLEKLQCPASLDEKNFGKAKSGLLRVWNGKVSASMSGLEYFPKEVEWILEQMKTTIT